MRRHSRNLRWASRTLLLFTCAIAACRRAQSGEAHDISPARIPGWAAPIIAPAYDSATGIALEASVSPSVVSGDGPVSLTYTLRNRGNAPVNLYVAPATVGIKVFAPSGRRLERHESGYIGLGTSDPPLALAPGGTFSRTHDLRCISWKGEVPVRTGDGKCGFRYDLVEPGEYRVFVHYRSGGTPEGPVKRVALDADTLRFTYRPE
jgi:hypothetical protein